MPLQSDSRKMSLAAAILFLAASGAILTSALADNAPTPPPASPPTSAPKPVPNPATKPAKPLSEAEQKATDAYNQVVDAYLKNDFLAFDAAMKVATGMQFRLTTDQRTNLEYIRKSALDQRPKWWTSTKASANTSFQAGIWGKVVTTNFTPSDELGMERPVEIRDNRLIYTVAWRPTNVDNPRAADGELAKTLHVTKGDIGEVVVWHELGHLFISSQISADAAFELYTKYEVLYAHLQEYFADMTAVYHASPHARRIALILRLDELDPPYSKYAEMEPHTRGANGIGASFLAEVLTNPAKWPNVHLPPKVPESEIELKTIVYMYEHFNDTWSLAEDKAMRDWAFDVVHNHGDQIFRSKGMIPLPDKNTFSLMEAQDRDFQKKRDAWVADKLEKAINAGLADKPDTKPAVAGGPIIKINGKIIKEHPLRIEVPME